jgi:hypothetical protein
MKCLVPLTLLGSPRNEDCKILIFKVMVSFPMSIKQLQENGYHQDLLTIQIFVTPT